MRSIAALGDASKTSGALRKRHAGRVFFCHLLHWQAEQGCNSKQVPQLRHRRAAAMLTLMLGVLMIGGKADANGKDGPGMATAVVARGVARVGGRTNGRDLKLAILGGSPTGQAISSKINECPVREMAEVELGMQRAVSLRKQAIGGHHCSTTVTDETFDHTDDPKESGDAGSGSTKNRPKTGKDHVPVFDGKTPMRDYARRVKLLRVRRGLMLRTGPRS